MSDSSMTKDERINAQIRLFADFFKIKNRDLVDVHEYTIVFNRNDIVLFLATILEHTERTDPRWKMTEEDKAYNKFAEETRGTLPGFDLDV